MVRFGTDVAAWVYRVVLAMSYAVAAAMLMFGTMRYAGILYMLTAPLAVQVWRQTDAKDLVKPGRYEACQTTVMLHAAGSLALAIGFVVAGLRG